MAKQKGKTISYRFKFGLLLILNKTIGLSFYQWLSLHIITPKILALGTLHLS